MRYLLCCCYVALLLFVACTGNKPPNLSPEATRAWYGTEILHDLDRVRDAAHDAHLTNPPLIDAATDLKIVTWHQQAIAIVHDAKTGWQAALQTTLTALQRDLPAATWRLISPYIALVQNILKGVQS